MASYTMMTPIATPYRPMASKPHPGVFLKPVLVSLLVALLVAFCLGLITVCVVRVFEKPIASHAATDTTLSPQKEVAAATAW